MVFTPTPDLAQFLLSPTGRDWLTHAADLPLTPTTHLHDLQTLRQHLSAKQAAAVVEQVWLRRRAEAKFSHAGDMLFVRAALEQATREPVAKHRARRFAGLARVADLGCGIGGDTLWLAQAADKVYACETNPLRLLFAAHNSTVYGVRHRVQLVQADILRPPVHLPAADAFFADPSRRTEAGRTFNPRQYQPPLAALLAIYARHPLGIKLAPGVNFSALPQNAEVEIVSLHGEAKEAVLWTGMLATPGVSRRATLLPSGKTLTDALPDACPQRALGDFLCEPDAAIIRAGLVKQAGALLGLSLVDAQLAYLSGSKPVDTPLVRCYYVETRLPLKLKIINRYLQANHIRRVNVKQRGTGLSPETVSRQLNPAREGIERTLILLRQGDEHIALICNP